MPAKAEPQITTVPAIAARVSPSIRAPIFARRPPPSPAPVPVPGGPGPAAPRGRGGGRAPVSHPPRINQTGGGRVQAGTAAPPPEGAGG